MITLLASHTRAPRRGGLRLSLNVELSLEEIFETASVSDNQSRHVTLAHDRH